MLYIRRVVGESMLPTLQPGQIIVAVRSRSLAAGDVIIVVHEGMEKIKRITAVRPDSVYIEGDNRTASTDSRHYGWVDRAKVRGKVLRFRRVPVVF